MRQQKNEQIFHRFFVAFLIFQNSSFALGNKYAHLRSLSSINHYLDELISSNKKKKKKNRVEGQEVDFMQITSDEVSNSINRLLLSISSTQFECEILNY